MVGTDPRSSNSLEWLEIIDKPSARVEYIPKQPKTLQGYYKGRVTAKGNVVFVFTARAKTRIGKTYMGMKIAEWFYDDFSVDDIVLTIDDYLSRLRFYKDQYSKYYRKFKKTGNWRVFPIILFDETGVEYGAMDFMSSVNKIMGYTLEAYGKYQVSPFFTLPLIGMLDSTGRRMLDMLILLNTQGRGQAYLKKIHPFSNELNWHSYCDVPKRVDGKQKKVPLPSKDLLEAYEEKKDEQLELWMQRFKEDLTPMETAKTKREELEDDIKDGKIDIHNIDKVYLASHYDMSMNYARDMLTLLKQKYIHLKKESEELPKEEIFGYEEKPDG